MHGTGGTDWKRRILPASGPHLAHRSSPAARKRRNSFGIAGLAWARQGWLDHGAIRLFQQVPLVPCILFNSPIPPEPPLAKHLAGRASSSHIVGVTSSTELV